jgi:hypothetical protein
VNPSVLAGGLVRDVPLEHDIVFSFVAQIGGAGSSVEVPGTGRKIDVPNGALPKGTKTLRIP